MAINHFYACEITTSTHNHHQTPNWKISSMAPKVSAALLGGQNIKVALKFIRAPSDHFSKSDHDLVLKQPCWLGGFPNGSEIPRVQWFLIIFPKQMPFCHRFTSAFSEKVYKDQVPQTELGVSQWLVPLYRWMVYDGHSYYPLVI